MVRAIVALTCLLSGSCLWAFAEEQSSYPSFDYGAARAHETQRYRHTIALAGVRPGFHQVHVTVTVSSVGDVISVDADPEPDLAKFRPKIQSEITQWKFRPFEIEGKSVVANLEEYIDLVPAQRLPTKHVIPPVLRPNSRVRIQLRRSACFGRCPVYTVVVTTEGIVFDGARFVAATGKHTDKTEPGKVRGLAKRFIDSDFYSMDSKYAATVTDNPTYVLYISIDGHAKEVVDYVGSWEGMPAVITDLEEEVDAFAHTARWIKGPNQMAPEAEP